MKTDKYMMLAAIAGISSCNPASATPPKDGQPDTKRPNILYIMSDDHCAQTIGIYASVLKDYISTPNIDRIGREGVVMNRCFVTNSISTPSRAAIITGQYSHHNGVYILDEPLPEGTDNVAKHLSAGGYHTGIVGKWHLTTAPEGFDYYSVLPGQGKYDDPVFLSRKKGEPAETKAVVEGYCTDIITDKCIGWMDEVMAEDDGPFFLMCHFKAPHTPFTPAPRHKDLYSDTVFPEPDNLYDDYDGRSVLKKATSKVESTYRHKELSKPERRREGYQEYVRRYLRCTAAVDENVGRLLDYLEEKGELDNTIVVYTSDQGFFLGEHGLVDKRFMYEESLRMPMLIRYPEEITAGSVSDDMVLNIDFAPTFLDYAGLSVPSSMDGRSFRNALSGREYSGRDAVYYRYWMEVRGYNIPAHYGIRTEKHKLIYFYRHENLPDMEPVWELYDLENDPAEMDNLYSDPRYEDVVKDLKSRLARLQEECGDRPE